MNRLPDKFFASSTLQRGARPAFLAALLCFVAFTGSAQGQPLVCFTTAVPPPIRAEGITERVADIVLMCTGGSGGSDATLLDLSVTTNVNITNDEASGSNADVHPSVLIVNENNADEGFDERAAHYGCTWFGTAGGSYPQNGQNQCPQYATQAADNRIEWKGVVFPMPASTAWGLTHLRISSIRANATQLGLPPPGVPWSQITAFVQVTSSTPFLLANNLLNVGQVHRGLAATPLPEAKKAVGIRLSEGYATAFMTSGAPNLWACCGWEHGYYRPGAGPIGATRILVRIFLNGVRSRMLSFPNLIGPARRHELTLRRVVGAMPDGTGGSISTSDGDAAPDEEAGIGYAVYEVVNSNPFVTESLDLIVGVKGRRHLNLLGQMNATPAPISNVFTASGPAPEPRFVDAASPIEISLSPDD